MSDTLPAPRGWERSENETQHGWSEHGNGVETFELRDGDASNSDKANDRDRSELKSLDAWKAPEGQFLKFEIRLPETFACLGGKAHIVLAQIHRRNRKLDNNHPNGSPILFQLHVRDSKLIARSFRQDPDATVHEAAVLAPLSALKNRWNEVAMAHVAKGGQQIVNITLNRGPVGASFALPETNADWEHYFKYGIYRNKLSEAKLRPAGTHTAQFRNVQTHLTVEDTP
ncbi:heparin lyase I family protein [Tateyamaria sp. SN6-1]|uniref:heparin lyase I family protein n=1 Tax=Tateyamaria sp. SN6-1 TaxID=3092148 RepID=UPI0039F591B6